MTKTRKIALGIVAVIVLSGVVGYFAYGRTFLAMANVGVGFVAKQMCSCIYVAERSFDSCRPDIFEAMDDVQAEVLEEPPGVRAWVPLIGERRAHYRGDFGCHLID
jgi:hypothetical protein